MNEIENRVIAAIGPLIQRALSGGGNTTVGEVTRTALATLPQGEPVAYLDWHPMVGYHFALADGANLKAGEAGRIPLYASPSLPMPEPGGLTLKIDDLPKWPVSEPSGWQAIETAPKDGRQMILLLTPSRFPQVAFSNTWWTCGFSVENKPTHWMPIPTPPEA